MKYQDIKSDSERKDPFTISDKRATLISFVLIIPISLLFIIPFVLIWHNNIIDTLKLVSLLIALLSLAGGIILHESIHGILWAVFSKNGFQSIQFGIHWQYLSPYCHCSEPLKVWQYSLGVIAPCFIMGIIPGIYALITGNAFIMFFAMFFTITAGGDLQSFWMLRKLKKNQIVMDHPVDVGFMVVDADQ